MSLKFFIDHCVPTSIHQSLEDAGHEILLLRNCIPTDTPDQGVIAKAQDLGAILVSINGDFADIVAYPPENYQGIIAIQLHDHPEAIPQLMQRLKDYLSENDSMAHYVGKLLIIEVYRIRVRI